MAIVRITIDTFGRLGQQVYSDAALSRSRKSSCLAAFLCTIVVVSLLLCPYSRQGTVSVTQLDRRSNPPHIPHSVSPSHVRSNAARSPSRGLRYRVSCAGGGTSTVRVRREQAPTFSERVRALREAHRVMLLAPVSGRRSIRASHCAPLPPRSRRPRSAGLSMRDARFRTRPGTRRRGCGYIYLPVSTCSLHDPLGSAIRRAGICWSEPLQGCMRSACAVQGNKH